MKNFKNVINSNQYLFDRWQSRREILKNNPVKVYPWWINPCKVKVLLITDGGLGFSDADFGMSAFVDILKNETLNFVNFELSLAHRDGSKPDSWVQKGAPDIKRSIKGFDFTDTNHFNPDWYDQIWFFGIESLNFALSEDELTIISTFMNNDGGVFATGDHGSLGKALCGSLPRVRSMRFWDNIGGNVGMTDPQRNDTNSNGHDIGSQFDDQSDDIPQIIEPKLYSSYLSAFWKETYPHPLLCSPEGVINVLPDHPHEGQCKTPDNLNLDYIDGSPEFPGGHAPEIIAHSRVPSGNTAGTKQATQAQRFGAICAYDGHKASIGRVVTESTWHHYTNVNLIGEQIDYEGNRGNGEHASKLMGFLYSTNGIIALNKIKRYFLNIAVWLSRPDQQICFNKRHIWELVYNDRILEATMNHPEIPSSKIHPSLLYHIGTHALDVLGKSAGQCRKLKLVLPHFELEKEIFWRIDPWNPRPEPNPDPVPWLDMNPLFAISLAKGLLAVRDTAGLYPNKTSAKILDKAWKAFEKGFEEGKSIGYKSFKGSLDRTFKYKLGK